MLVRFSTKLRSWECSC